MNIIDKINKIKQTCLLTRTSNITASGVTGINALSYRVCKPRILHALRIAAIRVTHKRIANTIDAKETRLCLHAYSAFTVYAHAGLTRKRIVYAARY